MQKLSEITFLVEDAQEGGFIARALGESIFTDASDLETLRANIRDAVLCHFDDGEAPNLIHMHYVHDEVIAV